MGKFIDLSGQRFGRLTVLERSGAYRSKKGQIQTRWLCRCDCGNNTVVHGASLKKGATRSCGCIRTETHTKHGHSRTRLYCIWRAMRHRCEDENNIGYRVYGAEGKFVCEEWKEFQSFYDWAMANGYADNLTIERKDGSRGYSPDNCRWATMEEQQNNRRNNRIITYNGETHTLAQWSKIKNIKQATIASRLNRGWSVEKALTTKTKA